MESSFHYERAFFNRTDEVASVGYLIALIAETTETTEMHGLTGYSHGVAGFVNAMLEIHQFVGGKEYLNAAREALTLERRRFDNHKQNWLDLRTEDSAPTAAWCHGAAGIGLPVRYSNWLELRQRRPTPFSGVAYPRETGQCSASFSLDNRIREIGSASSDQVQGRMVPCSILQVAIRLCDCP